MLSCEQLFSKALVGKKKKKDLTMLSIKLCGVFYLFVNTQNINLIILSRFG